MREIGQLVASFAKIGLLTFGGGYAIMPVAERELVRRRGWTTMEQIADYYAVAMVTPGIIGVNLSTFIGCSRRGAVGGIVATLSFIALPVALTAAVALTLNNFADIDIVRHAIVGIRVAAVALILQSLVKLARSTIKDWKQIAIAALCFIWSTVFGANPTVMIIAAACAGFMLYAPRGKPPVSGPWDGTGAA